MVLAPGSLLVSRFVVDRLAGEGGMGQVYRAQDTTTNQWVALKRLHGDGSADATERLLREARLLDTIRHPGIVSYIAHGVTPEGAPYLATEWLDGEDLDRRLARGPLSPSEALLLMEQICEPLAQAHKLGVIHRDLKPSNIFLVEGRLDRVKLLDFGIARRLTSATQRTKSGLIVGTPEYMSPEQARGLRELVPAVDVFALGCVLYQCLTGQTPFFAEHITAVLIRILFEPPTPLNQLCTDASAELTALVQRMLDKDFEARPHDASEVLTELRALGTGGSGKSVSFDVSPPPLAGGGRQLVSMVLALPESLYAARHGSVSIVPVTSTMAGNTLQSSAMQTQRFGEVRALLTANGFRVEQLADGALTAIFVQSGSMTATDLAVQAARGALLIKERSPSTRVALSTSRSTQRTQHPYREAISRAERLLLADPQPAGSDALVHIDDVTAGLIDGAFELKILDGGDALLIAERTNLDATRPLLGRPTPCVGREPDLAQLDMLLAGCIEEPAARAVLISAPPGIGKSRLRHEFLRRLRARDQNVEILIGRGDAMSAGASYGLLGQALRRLCGILDGEAAESRRDKLLSRVSQAFASSAPVAEQRRIAEFLGELCSVPFPDDNSPALRTARQDPYVMIERIREAFLAFLRAVCSTRPLLLVLEDLHWGDALTVRLIDAALRDLAELPFMVLALSRPEVKILFPNLWEGRQRQEIALGPLNRRACERLAGQVLGAQASAQQIARIVERAGGNALFLEELIRAMADHKSAERDELPETILAMLHARFARLDDRTRSVLHGASVFGETFWRGGVLLLAGKSALEPHIDGCLQSLLSAELIERHSDSRLADEVEYKFRHALVRDAAYGLLTEEERVLAHQVAGRYLEAAGEPEPMVLAEHYERGQVLSRAGYFYSRAAEQAHWGGDTPSAIARAERGLRCDLSKSGQAAMLALLAEAHGWSGDFTTGSRFAEQALGLSQPGSRAWASALATLQGGAMMRRDLAAMHEHTRTLIEVAPLPDAADTVAFALMATSYLTQLLNRVEDARDVVRHGEALCASAPAEGLSRGWLELSRAFLSVLLLGDPWAATKYAESARSAFSEAGHRRGALATRIACGLALWRLGQHRTAEEALRSTLETGADFGPMTPQRDACLAFVLIDRGKLDEALQLSRQKLAAALGTGRLLDEGLAQGSLAETLRHGEDLDAAEAAAQRAIVCLDGIEQHVLLARTTRAAILLQKGRPQEALFEAQDVLSRQRQNKAIGMRSALLHLICAEAQHALGSRATAITSIVQARDELLAAATRIDDAEAQQSFREDVPEHARILRLAAQWTEAATPRSSSNVDQIDQY